MRNLLVVSLIFASLSAVGAPVPTLQGVVNDYAGVLSPEQEKSLEAVLLDAEKASSNQIVVLTIASLDGETIEDFADKVFKSWKLGQADKDNGVLLINSTGDRKIRIEVGYGLEGRLTDGIAGEIIRLDITPPLKAGKYYEGFVAGIAKIQTVIKGEYKASGGGGTDDSTLIILAAIYIVTAIICLCFPPSLWLVGGLIGAIAGAITSSLLAFPIVITMMISIVYGVIVTLFGRSILESLAESGGSSGNSSGAYYSSSSSSGSSSSYSGGGGSSGGGGASGDY